MAWSLVRGAAVRCFELFLPSAWHGQTGSGLNRRQGGWPQAIGSGSLRVVIKTVITGVARLPGSCTLAAGGAWANGLFDRHALFNALQK